MQNLVQNDKNAWKHDYRLSLGGTSDVALDSYLERHRGISKLILCLDNDDAGQTATEKLNTKYSALGYEVKIIAPQGKDFNEDLIAYRNINRSERAKTSEMEI
jgi:DNA primase